MRLNRRWAQWMTRQLARLPVTPNQVTLCNLGIGMAALLALGAGNWASAVLGACCLELSYLLDNCDGELARLRGMTTPFGRWLDTAVDTVIHVALFPAMAVGLVRQGASGAWVAAGYVGGLATFVLYGIAMVQEWQPVRSTGGRVAVGLPAWHEIKDAARTDYALLVCLSAATGLLSGLFWVSVVGVVVLCVATILHTLRGGRVL